MPRLWRLASILAYWVITLILASGLTPFFPWPTIAVSVAFAWIYVALARGPVVVPPIAVLVLTLVTPVLVTLPIMWRLYHSWSVMLHKIAVVFWGDWQFWAAAALLPTGLTFITALVAARHRRASAHDRAL